MTHPEQKSKFEVSGVIIEPVLKSDKIMDVVHVHVNITDTYNGQACKYYTRFLRPQSTTYLEVVAPSWPTYMRIGSTEENRDGERQYRADLTNTIHGALNLATTRRITQLGIPVICGKDPLLTTRTVAQEVLVRTILDAMIDKATVKDSTLKNIFILCRDRDEQNSMIRHLKELIIETREAIELHKIMSDNNNNSDKKIQTNARLQQMRTLLEL